MTKEKTTKELSKIKITSAGDLIKNVLEIAQKNKVYDIGCDNNIIIYEEDIDKILFSLGFPPKDTIIRIEWGLKDE